MGGKTVILLTVLVFNYVTAYYSFYENTNSWYKVHEESETWGEAEATCVREGGHLAVVNNQDEADFLTMNFPVGSRQVLMGYRKTGDSWKTIYGQSLSEAGYENWHEGEPNNFDGDEFCGAMFPDGTFNDVPCSYYSGDTHFICEKDSKSQLLLSTTEAPTTITNKDTTDQDATTPGFNLEELGAYKCQLPSKPINGALTEKRAWVYKVDENRADEFVEVSVQCTPPYQPHGDVRLSCLNGEWKGTVAECRLSCKLYSHPSVTYFCRDTASGEERKCEEYVSSNTVVRPQCNENYYYRGDLPTMNCIDYHWDRITTCEPLKEDYYTYAVADSVEIKGQDSNVTIVINDGVFVKVSGSNYTVAVANVTDTYVTYGVPSTNYEYNVVEGGNSVSDGLGRVPKLRSMHNKISDGLERGHKARGIHKQGVSPPSMHRKFRVARVKI